MSTEVQAEAPPTETTPTVVPAPRKRKSSAKAAADDPTAPVFFTKTISRIVKKCTEENIRTTPESRSLIREALEAEGAKICAQARIVATHARGVNKEGATGSVRAMEKDLDVVLQVLQHEHKRTKLSEPIVKERKKRVKKEKPAAEAAKPEAEVKKEEETKKD
jgi:hypothetical protein